MKSGRKSDQGGRVDAPAIDVKLPNDEGEIQGDGAVEVEVAPTTAEPGDHNPLCDPTQPGCAPGTDDVPGSVEASARVRVRDVEVEVEVDSDDLKDGVVSALDL
jgi:hypothetical protein